MRTKLVDHVLHFVVAMAVIAVVISRRAGRRFEVVANKVVA